MGDLVASTDIWRREFLGIGIIIAKGDVNEDHALVLWSNRKKSLWWPEGGLEIVLEAKKENNFQ